VEFLVDVWQWFTDADHWRGVGGIPNRTLEHVTVSMTSVGIGAVLALPVGLLLGHLRRGGALAINVSNVGRAIPSFAILVLAFEVFGFGDRPTIVALVALAVPPMLTNSYVALSQVPQDVREAARGMGMTGWQVLARVELPMGLPLVMAGIRTAAVQVVATATLAAIIAGGGLGRYIVDGLAKQNRVELFAGGVLVALLAIATELTFGAVERLVSPRGVRAEVSHRPTERTSP
jgi:osmoprotectant transport system permease protein